MPALTSCALQAPAVSGARFSPWPVAAATSLFAGLLTPFTVSVGGLLPVGELLLFAAAAWALLIPALVRVWPGELWREPLFIALIAAQGIALIAYVVSDLWRDSAPADYLRGWSRMVFLAIDVAAIAYLVGCSAANFVLLVAGVQLGEILKVTLFGALFGDVWKFGYALPVTVGTLLLTGRGGPLLAASVAASLGMLHFILDFRSLGMICLLVGALSVVRLFPRAWLAWIAPLGLATGLLIGGSVYAHTHGNRDSDRSSRSDVERTAMVVAALEAFRDSPWIGNGSWFSRTRVMDNFMILREEGARLAGVGGFAGANEIEEDAVALHSQILVTLAEGGLFGGAFFLLFSAALARALYLEVVVLPWTPLSALGQFLLCLALFNVFLSPFSGAHRVHIALAAVLVVLVVRAGRGERESITTELRP